MSPSRLSDTIERAQRPGRPPSAPARRELRTRTPSGKPSWPLVLIAGGAKVGKTYLCAELSASPAVGRTLWLEVGESDVDLYAGLVTADGHQARLEPVELDGTFNDLCEAAQACVDAPAEDGKPNVIVLNSGTEVWDLLAAEQQLLAEDRPRGRDGGRAELDWTTAKARWRDLLTILRRHNGPVIITARLEQITTTGSDGRPAGDREKIRTEKNLPYDADLVVYVPHVREHWIGGVRSLKLQVPADTGWLRYPDMTLAAVFEDMGVLEPEATAPRHYVAPRPEAVRA